jgi:ribosomal protein L11 methyltransferase
LKADIDFNHFFTMPDHQGNWKAIHLTVSAEAAEAVEFALNSLDASGTSIDLMPKSSESVQVIGYFGEFPDEKTIQDELHYALKSYGLNEDSIITVERTEIENADWLAEWKKHWKPTTIGSFIIAAPWHDVDEPEKFVIRIEPNMAFGTGTHETTQLCLKAIDELFEPGDSFLDVGTGTGILAIAAALKTSLSRKTEKASLTDGNPGDSEGVNLLGFDTDPDAIKIAKENADLNSVGTNIEFHDRAIDEYIPAFDYVCANLTLDVIIPFLPLLLSKANKSLVLSGILESQKGNIRLELKNLEVSNFEIETAGEWIAVIVHR